jgi:hypothetical protein
MHEERQRNLLNMLNMLQVMLYHRAPLSKAAKLQAFIASTCRRPIEPLTLVDRYRILMSARPFRALLVELTMSTRRRYSRTCHARTNAAQMLMSSS